MVINLHYWSLQFNDSFFLHHRDSRQEFEKVGGIFPILHVVFLLDASN